jgi:hypothetical protein
MNRQIAEPCSFFNCLNTTLPEVLKVIVHFFDLVGRKCGSDRGHLTMTLSDAWLPGRQTKNLSQSSTPSLAHRRCYSRDRSNRLLDPDFTGP